MKVIERAVSREADNVILVLIVSDFQVLQGVPLISFEGAGPGQCERRKLSLIVELLLFVAHVLEHGVRSASRISLLGGRGHNQRCAVMAQYGALSFSGTGLTQTTKVTIDKISASFTVVSDSEITATVPTGAATGKITVTTKGGSATSSTSFTAN